MISPLFEGKHPGLIQELSTMLFSNHPVFYLLSHGLSEATPSYAKGPHLVIRPLKQISRGDSSNSYIIEVPNHIGTHIDTSNHFDPQGKPIAAYTIIDLIFNNPMALSIPKEKAELIQAEELSTHKERIAGADLLLIKTGFQKYRESQPEKYSEHNPGFSAGAAQYLARNFPRLRAIGLDFISLSSPEHQHDGREAHRALLTGRDFFIIEDMNLERAPKEIKRVFVIPLFIKGVDGTPCTVFAEA